MCFLQSILEYWQPQYMAEYPSIMSTSVLCQFWALGSVVLHYILHLYLILILIGDTI